MPPSGVSTLIAGAEGLGLSATDGGLSPPPPNSVEPTGIPTGPTGEPGEANGGDADAAQVPTALAVMPPPSNVALPDSPGAALAVPAAPVVEAAMPADAPIIGLAVGVKLAMAADAGNAPTHVVPTKGAAPDVVGLTPGVASSVAPRGIPVCPTGALGTPRGDVMPKAGNGETLIRAWASAEPQPSRTAAAVASTKRVIAALDQTCA
jgi:hypothetical protein